MKVLGIDFNQPDPRSGIWYNKKYPELRLHNYGTGASALWEAELGSRCFTAYTPEEAVRELLDEAEAQLLEAVDVIRKIREGA